jgi:hypothetical protein
MAFPTLRLTGRLYVSEAMPFPHILNRALHVRMQPGLCIYILHGQPGGLDARLRGPRFRSASGGPLRVCLQAGSRSVVVNCL